MYKRQAQKSNAGHVLEGKNSFVRQSRTVRVLILTSRNELFEKTDLSMTPLALFLTTRMLNGESSIPEFESMDI